MTLILERYITTRTEHVCHLCSRRIDAGEQAWVQRRVISGEGFRSDYLHPECWEFIDFWDEQDWARHMPGDITIQQVDDALALRRVAGQNNGRRRF